MKKQIAKKTNRAFGKEIFLLGRDSDGTNYWLEKASWDCGWYWGFGYVETYTNNKNPHLSKDISCHTHIDSRFMGNVENWDTKLGRYVTKHISNIYDAPLLTETTFTQQEGWVLSELFKTFYDLKKTSEIFHRGGSHITNNPCSEIIKNEEWCEKINKEILPSVFDEIYKILSPNDNNN
jgi:hypothetical protein